MDTIVITIPWAVVVLILLLALALTVFLVALLLLRRGQRHPRQTVSVSPQDGNIWQEPDTGVIVMPRRSRRPISVSPRDGNVWQEPDAEIEPQGSETPAPGHFCHQCGAEVRDGFRFCSGCGVELDEE